MGYNRSQLRWEVQNWSAPASYRQRLDAMSASSQPKIDIQTSAAEAVGLEASEWSSGEMACLELHSTQRRPLVR